MADVAVTGVGLAVPGAGSPEVLWESLTSGTSSIGAISAFDASPYTSDQAGMLDAAVEEQTIDTIPPRLRKRMDRFCQLAMSSASAAMVDAGLDVERSPEDIGIVLSNMFGGWDITEPSVRGLLGQGYNAVSPYIASAWFPTAPQGQISIARGLKGFAKTVVADTAGGALALGYGARAISASRARVVLAGGAEAPVTPYTYTFCETSGRLSPTTYRPFDRHADGFQVGEGAAVLTLEDADSAAERGAEVYALVRGFAVGHCLEREAFASAGTHVLARTIDSALEQAGVDRVDCVIADGQGKPQADGNELEVIRTRLGAVPVTSTKAATGHLLGAAGAVDALTAVLMLRHQIIPATTGCNHPVSTLIVTEPTQRSLRTVLLIARGADGTCVVTVLERP